MKIFIVFSTLLALSVAENIVKVSYDVDDVTPYEAAIVEFVSLGGILGECKAPHDECMAAAKSVKEKFQCFVKLGLCLGKRVAGCSKQCVIPLVMCKMSAGSSWPGLLKCATDFLRCAIGGCKQSALIEVPMSNDVTPYEVAIAEFELLGGILGECKAPHDDCMAAATSAKEKFKCFAKLGLCLGKRIVGCSKQCVIPLVMCKMSAGSSWPGLLKCATDFLRCAIGGCKQSAMIEVTMSIDVTPYEVAIAEFELLGGILGECKAPHDACMAAATSVKEKFQCFAKLGLCLGKRVVGCSKQCVIPLVMCKMSAGSSWPELLKCATDFLRCAIGGCKKNAEIEDPMSIDITPYEVAIAEFELLGGILGECKKPHEDCMAATTSVKDKFKCFVKLGVCLGKRVVGCSKQCVVPLVMCKMSAGSSWPELLKCATDFLRCAIGGCKVL